MPRLLSVDDLFDGSLDIEATYTPKGQPSFILRAIPSFSGFNVGAEAGKGLPKATRSYHAEFRHYRVKISDFEAENVVPSVNDTLTDDEGAEYRVEDYQKSHAGTYQLICAAKHANKGVPSPVTRR